MEDKTIIGFCLLLSLVLLVAVYMKYQKTKRALLNLDERFSRLEADLTHQKQTNTELTEELRQQKLEALRFALNPHTFRNTLHSIQFLARNTLNSVDSLANVFDYMLYDGKQHLVSLEHEAHFAKEYLTLYRIRLGQHVKVKDEISLEALVEDGATLKVAPMLLAHFIENAFKHGDLDSMDAFIQVRLELLGGRDLIFSVRNRVKEKTQKPKGGLGKNQFSERLELLYPGKYFLEYSDQDGVYSANLKLELYEA